MQTRLFSLTRGLVLGISAANVWATADGPDFYAVTRVDGTDTLYMRSAASSSARIVAYIPFNATRVQNLAQRRGGWCKVKYGSTSGWSGCQHLTESDGNMYYSTHGYTDRLNIRRAPSMSASVVGTVPPLETGLQGTGACNAYWCPIDYQGKRGWVGRRYLASWSF
ncbi:MAG: SH3 domain-containing protein [Gammaproteobacteria bacterium]|nr:SH3 domain-containing protein [Gammaproteobacteria bacterium]MBU1725505.1 SH3 domain-containing protein [Gammaproteobacteria bacterium]MBU2007363.1 SH3 domain-containing protein [Gammaproteobacteria bacterium]